MVKNLSRAVKYLTFNKKIRKFISTALFQSKVFLYFEESADIYKISLSIDEGLKCMWETKQFHLTCLLSAE